MLSDLIGTVLTKNQGVEVKVHMLIRRSALAVLMLFWSALTAIAQNPVWVQVEAQPSVEQATVRAAAYASQLNDVVGFSTGGRWNVIALGPYAPNDAAILLQQLKANRTIPNDSYIVDGLQFRQQFWPIGVGAATSALPLPGANSAQPAPPEDRPPLIPLAADETLDEARRNETRLTLEERELLQVALQWAGFYKSTIDGSFGRGTRRAMGAWQVSNGFESTGILTTSQRAVLLQDYNSVLDGMRLELVSDETVGVEILVPKGVVAFEAYDPPFARYEATGDIDAKVLLISQEGDRDRLASLFEVMQTLAVVPVEGPRARRDVSFELEGVGQGVHSYTYAQLNNGAIKGFTLVWPEGDDARRERILEEMRASFQPLSGVLDPTVVPPSNAQSIDLLAGLQLRQPQMTRSGFFLDQVGHVLTTSDVVRDCTHMTVENTHQVAVAHLDIVTGIAVLRPLIPLAPRAFATFQTSVPRLQDSIAVAGYPFGGILTTPSLTYGTLADIRGLTGDDALKRLQLASQDGDVGGPVLDEGGAVLGLLLPQDRFQNVQLPEDVQFLLSSEQIQKALAQVDVTVQTSDAKSRLPAQTLTQRAKDMTVLVSCW